MTSALAGKASTQDLASGLAAKLAKPSVLTLSLSVEGWSGGTEQTVQAEGVSADETSQEIHVMPATDSIKAWMDAGVYCSGQSEGRLTFTADSTPKAAITVYVTVWEVGA